MDALIEGENINGRNGILSTLDLTNKNIFAAKSQR